MIKLIVYQKNNSKPILITDDKSTLVETKEQCTKLFSSKKIYKIETSTDCLIGRPSELQSILISTDNINEPSNKNLSVNDKKVQVIKKEIPSKVVEQKEEIAIPQRPSISIIKEDGTVVKPQEQSNKKTEKIVMTLEELKKKQEEKKRENEKELQDMVLKYKDDVEVKL